MTGISNSATITPCPSGYVPVTSTFTTTVVQTITACNRYDYSCPVNSATPTVTITKTQTQTTVINVPTTTVYTTSIVDVCSTGLTTTTVTYTQTCNSGCTGNPSKPTIIPPGFTTTVKYCDACATPSSVTVTYCTACNSNPTGTLNQPGNPNGPIYNTGASVLGSPLSQPAQPNSSNYIPNVTAPGSSLSQPTSMPGSSSNSSYKVPDAAKPSQPIATTGSNGCSGRNCTIPSTTSPPQQFTGDATQPNSRNLFMALAAFIISASVLL